MKKLTDRLRSAKDFAKEKTEERERYRGNIEKRYADDPFILTCYDVTTYVMTPLFFAKALIINSNR
jgi:hypothetical protein